MNLDYIFPTPVWWTDLDIDVNAMTDIVLDIANNNEGQYRSNRGELNYQSPDYLGEQILNDESLEGDEFKKLLHVIKKNAEIAFGTYGAEMSHIEYANVWMNINGHGGYNEVHVHPGAVMSGVFYVKVPEGECGKLVFYKDHTEGYLIHSLGIAEDMSTAAVPHTDTTYEYPPLAGRLFLFPAWVPHAVRDNQTDDDRISISFNFVPVRNKENLYNTIRKNARKTV